MYSDQEFDEALRAAHGKMRVSAAKAAELYALLTDLNYHTEAALLEARQHGLHRIVAELERIIALRDQRGALQGLSDDGIHLARKRDQLIAQIQAHKDGEGRAENPPKKPVTVRFKPAELKAIAAQRGATYFVQSLERREAETGSWQEKVPGYFVASFLAGCQRHWTGLRYFRGNQVKIEPYGVNYDKPARSLSVTVKLDPNDTAAISEFTEVYVPAIVNGWIDAFETKARQEAALGAAGRTGNPAKGGKKKTLTVTLSPAELKAIAAQRGPAYFGAALRAAETDTPTSSSGYALHPPGFLVAMFLDKCYRYWLPVPAFQGAKIDIQPREWNAYNIPKSLSVSVTVASGDADAGAAAFESFVSKIVTGWIDAFEMKARQEAELGAAGRTGNPSDEYARVRSAIVNLRSFSKGALSGEDAANTGRHWIVDQPIYADGGASATHLSRDAARRFDAAQAKGELASSRGDQGWYVVFSQNLPIAWHTTADGWTVVDKSAVVGANPTTSRNIAIVKGALGLR